MLFSLIFMNFNIWEGFRVLDVIIGALIDMKRRSKVLKLDKYCMRDGLVMKKLFRI